MTFLIAFTRLLHLWCTLWAGMDISRAEGTMQPISRITTNWKEPHAIAPYETGVSLHSHTSISEETLHFIHVLGLALPGGMALTRHYERLCRERYGLKLDFQRANWRPPLQPKMAYEVEAGQIQK